MNRQGSEWTRDAANGDGDAGIGYDRIRDGREAELKGSDVTRAEMARRGRERMEKQSKAMKRHGGEAPRYDTSRDGLERSRREKPRQGEERSTREKLRNSTAWNRPPGRRRSSDGTRSKCIEKRLNGKAENRVEPSGYGIDQRREDTTRQRWDRRRAAKLRKGWAIRGAEMLWRSFAGPRTNRSVTEEQGDEHHAWQSNETEPNGTETPRHGNATMGRDATRWDMAER